MKLIDRSAYVAIIGVVSTLAASVIAFAWSGYKVVVLAGKLLHGESTGMAVGLVQTMDAVLIGAGLLIFALGLYELFVGTIEVPRWLVVESLDDLKSKLANIVALVMAVVFLEKLETATDPRELLYSGIAVSFVSGTLVLLSRTSRK